jgi:hypothetical protein
MDDRALHGRAHNDKLEQTLARCQEWKQRYRRIKLADTGHVDQPESLFCPVVARHDRAGRGNSESRPCATNPAALILSPRIPERDDAEFPQGDDRDL